MKKKELDSERLFTPQSMGPESADERARLYRRRQFHEVAPQRASQAAVMDFSYEERERFYRYINDTVLENERIDYLEFGVSAGESLNAWTMLNRDPESRFFGFDTFQGLPEDWHPETPAGSFSRGGKPPEVRKDPRVEFVVGLFQQTLADFSREFTPKGALVLHLDADLYSSTLYALTQMDRHIAPGCVAIFDEFIARDCTDEFAALQDYCRAAGRDYEVVARRSDWVKVAVRFTA